MELKRYDIKVKALNEGYNPSHDEINCGCGGFPLEIEKGKPCWFAYAHADGTWHRVRTSNVVNVTWFDGGDTIIVDTENSVYTFMR